MALKRKLNGKRLYDITIKVSHKLDGDTWSEPKEISGKITAGGPDEAAASFANKKVMDNIKVVIENVSLA